MIIMKETTIIKKLLREKKITFLKLAELTNKKAPTTISTILNSKKCGMRTDTVVNFLKPLDCELVIREKSTGREWIITESDAETEERFELRMLKTQETADKIIIAFGSSADLDGIAMFDKAKDLVQLISKSKRMSDSEIDKSLNIILETIQQHRLG